MSFHELTVRVDSACPGYDAEIRRAISPFVDADSTANRAAIHGSVRPFQWPEVARNLSPAACRSGIFEGLVEIYSHGPRHWIVDERWGMAQVDLLQRRWQSWILPSPRMDAMRCVEAAVLWPMAQLLRTVGMELLPALSIERGGWSALLLCPYEIPQEMDRLVRGGYRVIGRQWTAVDLRSPIPRLLSLPGLTQRTSNGGLEKNPWAGCDQAVCRSVMVIEPGRRLVTRGRKLNVQSAAVELRRSWPMVDLNPGRRRLDDGPMRLASHCDCLLLQLGRDTGEFVKLIDYVRRRDSAPMITAAVMRKTTGAALST